MAEQNSISPDVLKMLDDHESNFPASNNDSRGESMNDIPEGISPDVWSMVSSESTDEPPERMLERQYQALAALPDYDIAEETAKGNIDEAMAVARIRESMDNRTWDQKALDYAKAVPRGVEHLVKGAANVAGNVTLAARAGGEQFEERRRAYQRAIDEGKSTFEANEAAKAVQKPLEGAVAEQTLLSMGQLGAMQGLDTIGRVAGSRLVQIPLEANPLISGYRDARAFLGAEGGIGDRIQAVNERRKDLYLGRTTPEEEREKFIRDQMMELQRREILKGRTTGVSALDEQEIRDRLNVPEGQETPELFDAEQIETGSVVGDPTSYVGLGLSGSVGRNIAGRILRPVGRITESVFDAPISAGRRVLQSPTARRAAQAGGAIGAGYSLYQSRDPIRTAAYALGGAGLIGLGLGGRRFGRIVREAGEEALSPNFVSQSGRSAAQQAMSFPSTGFAAREAFSPAQNIAAAERMIRGGLVGGTQGALEAGTLASGYADNPEQVIQEALTGAGLGGLMSLAVGVGSQSPGLRRDAANVLGEQRAATNFGTGFDAAHAQAMASLPADAQNTINKVGGWLMRMRNADGTPIQVYALDGNSFANAVAADGNPRDQSALGQAYTTRDGSKVFVNADVAGGSNAAGHEIGHVIQRALSDQIAPQFLDALAHDIRQNLYNEDGTPNKQFEEFIKNRFGDEQVSLDDAASEYVGELAMNTLRGANIDDFVLPSSIRRKVKRGATNFLRDTLGFGPETGVTFNGQEIAMGFDTMSDILFDIGRIAREGGEQSGQGTQFRVEQIDALLAEPLPQNATTEQINQRNKLQKERDTLLDAIIESQEFPVYNPPPSEVASKRNAYIDSIPENLKRSKEQRAEAEQQFNEYAEHLKETGQPFPPDDQIGRAVLDFQLQVRDVPSFRQRPVDTPIPDSRTTQSQAEPIAIPEPEIVSPDGSYVDPENPNRIIRPRPESTPPIESPATPEIAPAERQGQRMSEQPKTGADIVNEYVELGDILSDPLPLDATPEQISERRNAARRRRAIEKQLRDDFGIDASQLDDIPSDAGIGPEPSIEPAPNVEAESPTASVDRVAEPEVAITPEPPVTPEIEVPPLSQETSPVVDIAEPSVAPQGTPSPESSTERIAIQRTPDQISQIDADIADAISREYSPGRKKQDRIDHDLARLRRIHHAQRHASAIIDPNLSDAVTWRVDDLTGNESISGKRFIEGDYFNDMLLSESGLTPEQITNLREIQSSADAGEGAWIVYDSAERASPTRAEDQAKSTASQRASGEGASELKKDIFFMTGASINNPATPSTQAGKVTLRGVLYDPMAGNAKKIANVLGDNSPYQISPDGTIPDSFARDVDAYALNQRNGWKGSGLEPIQSTQGIEVTQNPDFIPVPLDADPAIAQRKAEFINLAMNDTSASGKSERSSQRRSLAEANEGFLTESGETNPIRDELSKSGKLPSLDRVSANIAADLIYSVGQDAASSDVSPLRSTAREIEAFKNNRIPRNEFVSAGFRPDGLGIPEFATPRATRDFHVAMPRRTYESDQRK